MGVFGFLGSELAVSESRFTTKREEDVGSFDWGHLGRVDDNRVGVRHGRILDHVRYVQVAT